jgi:hypothetical protein
MLCLYLYYDIFFIKKWLNVVPQKKKRLNVIGSIEYVLNSFTSCTFSFNFLTLTTNMTLFHQSHIQYVPKLRSHSPCPSSCLICFLCSSHSYHHPIFPSFTYILSSTLINFSIRFAPLFLCIL